MLARLSIRDIVLIERLDIDFASGLSVLTGETGAGKSMLLDAYAGLDRDAIAVGAAWTAWRAAVEAVTAHRARVDHARREAEWLRHAVDELKRLAPAAGEETALADRRARMMQAEKVADD